MFFSQALYFTAMGMKHNEVMNYARCLKTQEVLRKIEFENMEMTGLNPLKEFNQ